MLIEWQYYLCESIQLADDGGNYGISAISGGSCGGNCDVAAVAGVM